MKKRDVLLWKKNVVSNDNTSKRKVGIFLPSQGVHYQSIVCQRESSDQMLHEEKGNLELVVIRLATVVPANLQHFWSIWWRTFGCKKEQVLVCIVYCMLRCLLLCHDCHRSRRAFKLNDRSIIVRLQCFGRKSANFQLRLQC